MKDGEEEVKYAAYLQWAITSLLLPGICIAAFTNINLVGFGIVGTVLALLYIQLSSKYNLRNDKTAEIEEL
ncbi:hypothetical protein ABEW24_08440 [Paenibacillus jamilae]|nr:hypothetical protein [Paenibacillus polymyxa]KYG93401.1 hypothetical protein AZE31_06025 [Paenibacillus polymyxa]